MPKAPRPPLKTGPSFSGEFQEYTSSWMVAMMTEDNSNSAKVCQAMFNSFCQILLYTHWTLINFCKLNDKTRDDQTWQYNS